MMKRRKFLQTSLYTALSTPLVGKLNLVAKGVKQFDRYGGWTGKKFTATGFFRVEKDKRWWLVSPEGNAFLSFGINHLHPNWWKQDFSRSAWEKKLGGASLDTPKFDEALRTWFLQTCQEYGFNSIGVHNDLALINSPHPTLPYMQPIRFLDIAHWRREVPDENFKDVFSPEFTSHCDRLARRFAAPLAEDPFLLGYAMTDCPLFTEEDCRARTDVIGGARRDARIGWPRRLRNLGPEAPGKQAYVELMKETYQEDIEEFNKTYRSTFSSFDDLAKVRQWRFQTDLSNANETRDNLLFLHRVVKQYYQTTRDAIRRYDPNHLFVGDKLNANTDSLDTVLPIISQFVDIILYQMYGRYEIQAEGLDRWAQIVDKPIINGDAAFTMISEHMPRPYGPIADNLKQRSEWTIEFFRKAFARPEFVGWHYCGLIDTPTMTKGKEGRQHSGLMDGYGNPYALLRKALKENVSQLYQIAGY